jgi:hypothetical protein
VTVTQPTTTIERKELIQLPELLPSDAVNLADTRVPCTCGGECSQCRGKGTRAADTGREHLSHSSISTLLNCEQRYGFERVHHLELITAPKPLDMGRAFQRAIEHGRAADAADELARSRRASMSQHEHDAVLIDMAIVRCAAQAYLARWPTTLDGIREYEYRVRLRNPHTGRYSNTFDLLGYADELRDLGDSWELTENKLVGQIGEQNIRRLPLDRQLALSCYGVWRATGKPVSDVRYRLTRKPSIKKKQGESTEQFIARLAHDYEVRRDDFYTHEEHLFRSTEDLVQIEAELWRWAEQLRAARRERVWARNSSHCHDYGGCPFIPLCVGDPDAPALYRVTETNDEEVPLA